MGGRAHRGQRRSVGKQPWWPAAMCRRARCLSEIGFYGALHPTAVACERLRAFCSFCLCMSWQPRGGCEPTVCTRVCARLPPLVNNTPPSHTSLSIASEPGAACIIIQESPLSRTSAAPRSPSAAKGVRMWTHARAGCRRRRRATGEEDYSPSLPLSASTCCCCLCPFCRRPSWAAAAPPPPRPCSPPPATTPPHPPLRLTPARERAELSCLWGELVDTTHPDVPW